MPVGDGTEQDSKARSGLIRCDAPEGRSPRRWSAKRRGRARGRVSGALPTRVERRVVDRGFRGLIYIPVALLIPSVSDWIGVLNSEHEFSTENAFYSGESQ